MNIKSCTLFLSTLALLFTCGHLAAADNSVIQTLSSEEHQRSMAELKIESLRQGANGNDPEAPNAANYDEEKANPYPHLPELLLSNNRELINTPEQWWEQRRPEIVEMFDREVYGRAPQNLPTVQWQISSESQTNIDNIPTIRKELTGTVDNSDYPELNVEIKAILITPKSVENDIPIIVQFSSGFFLSFSEEGAKEPDSWQSQTLSKGWGYAYLDTSSIQADNGAGLNAGIIGLGNKGQARAMDDWGVLRAWAWGASRLMDYFETSALINENQVALEGHSRWGKAAIVAMAYDQRFALGYISSSGAGGAKLHRRNWGELVENVAGGGEYHWMAGNYIKYAGPLSWDDLPVDSHQLIALVAPRPLFISGGNEGDLWVDAKGMFMAAAAAQPIYRLLGAKDMGTKQFPELEQGLMEGEISFRQHSGGHTDAPNWPTFLEYAERYFD